jgi:hypothetical protein
MAAGFYSRSVNNEWFRIRIILKDGVIAGGDSCGIFNSSPQLKTYAVPALSAEWETRAFQQSGFMHQAMRGVHNSVNPTVRHQISRLVFLSHPSILDLINIAEFWRRLILKDY